MTKAFDSIKQGLQEAIGHTEGVLRVRASIALTP